MKWCDRLNTFLGSFIRLLVGYLFQTTYGSRSVNSLNVFLWARRKIIMFLGYRPPRDHSVFRREMLLEIASTEVCSYSSRQFRTIVDPRNGLYEGHVYNERHKMILHDVVLEPFQGLVYSTQGNLLRESTNLPVYQAYHSFPYSKSNHYLTRKVKSAIYVTSNSFWHWVIEDLPLFLRSLDFAPDVPIICSSRPPRYVKDLLNRIDRDVLYVQGLVRVQNLIFFAKGEDAGWPHPSDIELLRQHPLLTFQNSGHQSSGPKDKDVFILRGKSRRTPKNESALSALFQELGFFPIDTTDMNLFEEISFFRDVRLVAGVHGAGLVNMLWTKSHNSGVFDIVNENYWTESSFRLANLLNLRYAATTTQGNVDSEVNLSRVRSDFLSWV